MGWVYLDHPDTPGGPERFPDDPTAVAVAEAKGWIKVADPTDAPVEAVDPDEVDDRGQGWTYLDHPDLPGGPERFPVEAAADLRSKGWLTRRDVEAAAAKKTASKKKTESTPVGDETPEEK